MERYFSRTAAIIACVTGLAVHAQDVLPTPTPTPTPAGPAATITGTAPLYDLGGLTTLMLQRDPRLARAGFAAEAAAGRAVQAGLYPNPVFSFSADELADRTGRTGILTPAFSQEIVTAGKLGLSQAAAERERQRADLEVMSVRFARTGAVRAAFFDLLALQRRIDILNQLVRIADESMATSEKLRKAGQSSQLDVVQLEVEAERLRAEQEAANRERPGAFRRLAAAVGVPGLPLGALVGSLDAPLPDYRLDEARAMVSALHPDVLAAKKGVEQAGLLLERAKVEPKPNVTVQVGYTYQSQNRSNDAMVGLSLPLPIWNKNQGNIAAAHAQLAEATQDVGRVESELTDRVGQAFAAYASARRRAEAYRERLLPKAREALDLSLKGYRAGQFDYLRVLEAQRAFSQADLEAVRSLGEAWKAAAELSALLLQDRWPAAGPKIEIHRPEPPR